MKLPVLTAAMKRKEMKAENQLKWIVITEK